MPPWKTVGLVLSGTFVLGVAVGYSVQKMITAFFVPLEEEKGAEPWPQEGEEMENDSEQFDSDSLSTTDEPSRNAFLLSTVFRPALLNILNKCEPESFVRMSLTCKGIRMVCLNSKGIRVNFPCKIAWYSGVADWYTYEPCVQFKYLHENEGWRVIYGRQLENLKRLPFHFQMHVKFNAYIVTEEAADRVFGFIRKFPKFSLSRVFIKEIGELGEVDCWPEILEFFKEFSVGLLMANTFMDDEEYKSLLQLNFDDLHIHRSIMQGTMWMFGAKRLHVKGSKVSAEEFKDFLGHISQDEVPHLHYWNFHELHRSLRSPDALKHCFDEFTQIPFADEGVLPVTRPLISFHYDGSCCMLTRSNAVVKFEIAYGRLSIVAIRHGECTVTELPRLFRPFFISFRSDPFRSISFPFSL